jgi:membrane protein YqaA with SNARE-associated domain
MAKNLLLTTLYKRRIEIKYVIITLVLVGGLFLLASGHVFDGLEQRVNTTMVDPADYGVVGTFLIALASNWTLVIQVPYNLPMFTLLIYADGFWEVTLIGAATGLGGGIGEVMSYALARAIIANMAHLEDSALFRWTKQNIERRPGLIPYLVWSASAFPVPDLVIIMPVAMVKYPWRKVIVPMLTGKVLQNVVVAFIFRYAADRASGLVSKDINIDLTAFIVIMFVLIIAYQIEKSQVIKRENVAAAREPVAAPGVAPAQET